MSQVGPGAQSDAPQWLVDLVMTPPWWALLLLVVATLACVALAVRTVYRRDMYISLAEQRDMLLIVGTIEAIAVGVILSMGHLSLGYAGDVAVGLVSGFLAVEVLRRIERLVPARVAAERARVALAWAGLGVGAFALPALAANGQPYPSGVDIAIGAIGAIMLFWTIIQEYGPGKTVGDVARAE